MKSFVLDFIEKDMDGKGRGHPGAHRYIYKSGGVYTAARSDLVLFDLSK